MRIIAFCLLLFTLPALAQSLDFSLHKKTSGQPGRTLLIIGGIQGDEPGGFLSASLIATRYEITEGNVWVVPNLNFPSILDRSRGTNGDMNRKFAHLDPSDPDYETVERIKTIITDPHVDLVLNLHDGSGFYHEEYIDTLNNPRRWGQSLIIDQIRMNHDEFGNLQEIAHFIADKVNQNLLDRQHEFRVKNTQTSFGNAEMEKALTWFAIQNNKPALANETSKTLPTHLRVYYQLVALEAYMDYMGIKFTKDFELTPESVREVINDRLQLWLHNRTVSLNLVDIRPFINYFPMQKGVEPIPETTNPLIAMRKTDGLYQVFYGNRKLTTLKPEYFDFASGMETVTIVTDRKTQTVSLGEQVEARSNFYILPTEGIRANVIGYVHEDYTNESGLIIQKDDLMKRFSLDSKGTMFRLEFYRADQFLGMVTVRFIP